MSERSSSRDSQSDLVEEGVGFVPAVTAEVKPIPAATPSKTDDTPLTMEFLWERVWQAAQSVMQEKMKVQHLEPVSFDGHTLRLAITPDGASVVRFLQNNLESIAALVKRATGQSVRIELDTTRLGSATEAPSEMQLDQSQRHPLVEKARELFDAVLVNVEATKERH